MEERLAKAPLKQSISEPLYDKKRMCFTMKQKKAPDTKKSSGQFAKTALVLASTAAAIWAIWTLPVAALLTAALGRVYIAVLEMIAKGEVKQEELGTDAFKTVIRDMMKKELAKNRRMIRPPRRRSGAGVLSHHV